MIAYSLDKLFNLAIIKEAKLWSKHQVIATNQYQAIHEQFRVSLYHPNWMIRILLFVAGLLALLGVTGILGLLFADLGSVGISVLCVLYGIGSVFFLEVVLINKGHYKSGITEVILYHACGFTAGGLAGLVEFDNTYFILMGCLVVFTMAAIRYLDLITTLAAFLSFAGLLFMFCYDAGGLMQQLIPLVFLVVCSSIYLLVKRVQRISSFVHWQNNLLVLEVLSLITIYLSGNYWVVRELSIELMDLSLAEGEDIPLAWVFYFLTAAIPGFYLIAGINNKDVVLLRISVLVFVLAAATFKYYFIKIELEWILLVAGAFLTIGAILLIRFLKHKRSGFTSKSLLTRSWESAQIESLIIAQTVGGNVSEKNNTMSGGGESGGGGSSSTF